LNFLFSLRTGRQEQGVKVTITGLGEYAKNMTKKISRKIGHVQTPLIINFEKDSPLYQLDQ